MTGTGKTLAGRRGALFAAIDASDHTDAEYLTIRIAILAGLTAQAVTKKVDTYVEGAITPVMVLREAAGALVEGDSSALLRATAKASVLLMESIIRESWSEEEQDEQRRDFLGWVEQILQEPPDQRSLGDADLFPPHGI